MENLNSSQISGENIDHLGLVAGVIKKTKLIERIDKILPIAKEKGAKVTMGERGRNCRIKEILNVPLLW